MQSKEWMLIYNIVGAAMEVHNVLGRGLSEAIYQEALKHEFLMRHIHFLKEEPIHAYYKGILLDKVYIPDFICDSIIVELKATEEISSDHRAQLFNYLRIAKKKLGILVNFGERNLHAERYLYSYEEDNFILLTTENFKYYIDED